MKIQTIKLLRNVLKLRLILVSIPFPDPGHHFSPLESSHFEESSPRMHPVGGRGGHASRQIEPHRLLPLSFEVHAIHAADHLQPNTWR